MIKTIISDLGNVIVSIDEKKRLGVLAKYTEYSPEYISRVFIFSKARRAFEKGKISPEMFFMYFKNKLGLRLNFAEFKKIWNIGFELNRDIESLLKNLKRNYRLVMLSNTDEIHFPYLKDKYKILDLFDNYILSYKVGMKKPNPFIFIRALQKANAKPSQCIYIDDINVYILIAKFLGINAVHYKSFEYLKRELEKYNLRLQ